MPDRSETTPPPGPYQYAQESACEGRHDRAVGLNAKLEGRVDKIDTKLVSHDRKLITLLGHEGEDGTVQNIQKRMTNASKLTITMLVVAIGLTATMVGSWVQLSGSIERLEARQEIMLERGE